MQLWNRSETGQWQGDEREQISQNSYQFNANNCGIFTASKFSFSVISLHKKTKFSIKDLVQDEV